MLVVDVTESLIKRPKKNSELTTVARHFWGSNSSEKMPQEKAAHSESASSG